MNIHDAVKQAQEEQRCITLPEFRENAKIKPTNEIGNCILMKADGSHPTIHGWQPMANDLIRGDWMVVD